VYGLSDKYFTGDRKDLCSPVCMPEGFTAYKIVPGHVLQMLQEMFEKLEN
jgi:hypothetical protein